MKLCQVLLFVLISNLSIAQISDDAAILQIILNKYYKTEKPVYKGRSQLLYFYCARANNNEEMYQVINERKLPAEFLKQVKESVRADISEQTWQVELDAIYADDKTKLQMKINGCRNLEDYQQISKKLNLNNQRLMIVSKPLYYAKTNIALVKVVFYRNIEHNNGSVLLLEKENGRWIIKEFLNAWST